MKRESKKSVEDEYIPTPEEYSEYMRKSIHDYVENSNPVVHKDYSKIGFVLPVVFIVLLIGTILYWLGFLW